MAARLTYAYSIRFEPDDVSWGIIVANPDLSPLITGYGTPNGPGLAPNKLRIVAADAGAGIAVDVVSPCFLGPGSNNLVWRRVPAGYCVYVLAISVVGAVG